MLYPTEIMQEVILALREYNQVLEEYEIATLEYAELYQDLQYKKALIYVELKNKNPKTTENYIESYVDIKLRDLIEKLAYKEAEIKVYKEKLKFLSIKITANQSILNYMREELRGEGAIENV